MPVLISAALLVVITALFLYEFVVASAVTPDDEAIVLTASTYMDIVAPLLANADPLRGEQLTNVTYECHVCHVQQANQIAPAFVGLGQRAGLERPPLKAAAYLYESIMYPTAHVVEGYSAAMPANYPARLTSQDVGDIIAYLLTQ